jgi:hypothetical protein
MNPTEENRLAAGRACGQPVTHLESVPVVETFRGQVMWDGIVEVYAVPTPPPARVYGWTEDGPSGEPQYIAILGVPPINSPLDAVRAWLVSQIRK